MRLSRLRRLLSSEFGFFPNISKYDLNYMKYRMHIHSTLDPPDLPYIDHQPKCPKLLDQLYMRFRYDKPKYPKLPTSINNKCPNIKLRMLLDNAYQSILFPPELSLKIHNSKYIMFCCFFVPMLTDSQEGSDTKNFISVASELRELYGSDFELVLVAKMRQGWFNHKPSFDHFFSGFPSFCRVIPFSDLNTRNHICQLLGLYDRNPVFLLLERSSDQTPNPNYYKVLNHSYIDFIFDNHGADFFPFTEEIRSTQSDRFDQYPSQIDRILGRKTSEIHLSSACGSKSVSLSELEGKLVGFYLCFDGSLMLKLDQVSRECEERGLEFEVVVVYMPFSFICNVNTLMELINNDVLYKLNNTRSWWIMPYIDSISRRLKVMTPSLYDFGMYDDRLIIVGPNGKYVDPYAGAFLRKYGVDVYPFTCERLIEWKLEKVRSVTLESLLVHGSRDFVLGKASNGGDFLEKVPVKQLYGKVVLVYFYYHRPGRPSWPFWPSQVLSQYYHQIKSRHPNFEAVSVSLGLDDTIDFPDSITTSESPPWLVCPPQPDHSKYVYDMLRIDEPAIVAFGEDGRVCSFRAEDMLETLGVDAFPFNGVDNLRQEVTCALAKDNNLWNIPQLGYKGWG